MYIPLLNLLGVFVISRNILAISPVCPRHCSMELMKHVFPRLDIPTRPPESGNSAAERGEPCNEDCDSIYLTLFTCSSLIIV